MADVAQKAGVSRATVSRTLSNPSLVTEHTRETVLAAIAELGYVPNVNAQILAAKTSSEVGLLLRAPRNPTYGAFYQFLQTYCSKANIDLISAAPSAQEDCGEVAALQRIVGTQPAGLLIATGSIDLEIVKAYSKKIPTVILPRPVSDPALNAVSFDEYHDARAIAQAVYDHGHRKVAVATRPPHTSSVEKLRTQTMTDWLRELGAEVQELLYDAPPDSDSFESYIPSSDLRGFELERQMLPDRTVLMFANDLQAAIHIAHMKRTGRAPGEDLSITGMDGMEPWDSALDLATVTSPVKETSQEAVRMLVLLLENPHRQTERRKIRGTLRLGSTLARI